MCAVNMYICILKAPLLITYIVYAALTTYRATGRVEMIDGQAEMKSVESPYR